MTMLGVRNTVIAIAPGITARRKEIRVDVWRACARSQARAARRSVRRSAAVTLRSRGKPSNDRRGRARQRRAATAPPMGPYAPGGAEATDGRLEGPAADVPEGMAVSDDRPAGRGGGAAGGAVAEDGAAAGGVRVGGFCRLYYF